MQENTNSAVCPCCGNHCPAEALQCGKGRNYFEASPEEREHFHAGRRHHEREEADKTMEGRVIALLRRCGHHLHHNAGRGADSAQLLSFLSEEEKESLAALLEKCVKSWQTPER